MNASGIEISRISTNTVATAPRPITTRLSGSIAGSSTPASRRAYSASTPSPTAKTSLPSAPVCQPITLYVIPPCVGPAYQSVKGDTASSSPESQVRREPIDQ